APRLRSETILEVADRCNFDRDTLPTVKFGTRRTDPHHSILPILCAEILENLVADGSIGGDFCLPDESRTICLANPHQYRTATADPFGFPGSLFSLNQDRVVISPKGKPYRRSSTLSSVLADRRNIHQLGFG